MTKYLSRRTAMSPAVAILLAFCCGASAVHAQGGPVINGVYNGTYMCRMERNVKLSLFATPNGVLTAMFTFYPSPGSASTFSLNGTYDAATQKFTLQPSKWETPEPPGFAMVGMEGTYNPGGAQISGKIIFSGCYGFQATKDAAASANVGAAMAQQKAGTASAQAAPPTSPAPPAAATPARPTQASQAPRLAPALPAPTAQAASATAPAGSIKFLCYSIDPKQPVVYFSDIFDIADEGNLPGNFMNYELAKDNFDIFLNEKYGYVSTDADPDKSIVECQYQTVGSQKPEAVTQLLMSKKQTLTAQAAAAKKQAVSTGWIYKEEPDDAAAGNRGGGAKTASATPPAPSAAATPSRPTQTATPAAPAAPIPAASAAPNRPAAAPTSRAAQSSAPTAAQQTTAGAARAAAPSKGTPVASSLDYLPSAKSNPPNSNPPSVKTDFDVEMSLPPNLRRLKVTAYFSMTPQQQADALMTIIRAYGALNLYNAMVMPQYINPPQPALQELKGELERARKDKIPDLIDVESRIRMDYNKKAWEIALKNPKDTRWINTLVQVQESILVRGLVTGDFSEMQGNRVGALNYIRGFNDDLGLGGFDPLDDSDDPGGDCPDLYDESLSNAAAAEIPTPTAGDLLAGVARMAKGVFFGAEVLGYQIEQLKTLYNNGGQDANTMANVQFDGCEGSLLLKMVANAKAFVRARPQAAPAQAPAPAVAAPRSSQPSSRGASPRYSK